MELKDLVFFLILLGVLVIVYKLVMRTLRIALEKRKIPVDGINAFKMVFRIIIFFIGLMGLFVMLGVESENIVSISAISGMVLGFASSEVMAQIIAGFYIIITKPFGVRDLVDLNGVEGIVLEIGVTYTRLQRFDGVIVKIPNKTILDSKIKNYSIDMEDIRSKSVKQSSNSFSRNASGKKQSGKDQSDKSASDKRQSGTEAYSLMDKFKSSLEMDSILGHVSEFLVKDEINRYLFKIEINLNLDPKMVLNELDRICEKYRNDFGFKPRFIISNLAYRAEYTFRIYCANPRIIINKIPSMLEEIAYALYGKKEVL